MLIKGFLWTFFAIVTLVQGFKCDVMPGKAYTLKQVVILSRHGVRTPLSKYLPLMTPKKWPQWSENTGYLTARGARLEGFMGKFLSSWLIKTGLISKECPTEETFFVYANTKQRTLASAKAFVNSAFPGCNITIYRSVTDPDPIFNPIIHNTSSVFHQLALEEMRKNLEGVSVNATYVYLENVLDYRKSELCKAQNKCNFVTDKNKVIAMPGDRPSVSGPLKICNSVIDAFLMEYYSGFALEDVAWDSIRTTRDWQTVMPLSHGYHKVIFNSHLVAADISRPLIEFMKSIFLNETVPTVSLLMGHDSNIYTLLSSLRCKPYTLPEQYELVPISGKIVFQKWYDNSRNEELLKIDYVYQSSKQLRDGSELNLKKLPHFFSLQLEDCKIDDNGFCLWTDFVTILEGIQI